MTTYFERPDVSNSKLSLINPKQGGSPGLYQSYDPAKEEQRITSSLEKGKLLHLYMFERDLYITLKVDKPTDKMGIFVDKFFEFMTNGQFIGGGDREERAFQLARSAAEYPANWKDDTIKKRFNKKGDAYYQELLLQHQHPDKIGITRDVRETIEACTSSLSTDAVAHNWLYGYENCEVYNEKEFYWDEMVTYTTKPGTEIQVIIPRKVKIDRLIIDHERKDIVIIDLKTTGNKVQLFGENSFKRFRYYRQGAYYIDAVKAYLMSIGEKVGEWEISFLNIVVETSGRYEVGMYWLNDFWRKQGEYEVNNLLRRIAWHTQTGIWDKSFEQHMSGGYLPLSEEPVYDMNKITSTPSIFEITKI